MKLIAFFLALFSFTLSNACAEKAGYEEKLLAGLEAVNRRDISAAREVFGRLLEVDPSRPEALCGLAIAEIEASDYRAAREHLVAAIKQNAAYAQVYFLLGMVEEHLRNYRPAAEYYTRFIELDSGTELRERALMQLDYVRIKADE